MASKRDRGGRGRVLLTDADLVRVRVVRDDIAKKMGLSSFTLVDAVRVLLGEACDARKVARQ